MTTQKEFKCPRCGYDTNYKAHYIKHLNILTPCPTTLSSQSREDIIKAIHKPELKGTTVECSWCKKLITKKNMLRHQTTCHDKPVAQNEASTSTVVAENTQPIANNKNLDITNLQELMTNPEFQKLIDDAVDKRLKNNKTTQNNIYVQNNNTIILNNFGNEDISHLTHDFLSHCLLNPTKGITNLIGKVHYDNDVPSNNNIRYKSTKQNTLEKYVDSHWMICDASNTLDELIKKGYRILNAHYAEHYLNDPEYFENEIKQQFVERFRFLSDKTCNDYYSVKRDLRMLIKDKTMFIIGNPTVDTNNTVEENA